MVAAAVVGSAVVGAAATSYAGSKAADAQKDASKDASATEKYMYDQTRADNLPALQARNASLARLQDLLGLSGNTSAAGYGSLTKKFTGANLASEPGYQFGLNQGLDSVQNSAAAKGGLYSGATLKALTQYGTDYAGTKYNDAYNRFNNDQTQQFNRLTGLATGGQVGAGTIASAGQNYADQVSSNLIGAGNARAASTIATGNALANGLNQGAAWWMRQSPSTANLSVDTGGYGIDPYGQLGGASTAGDYSDARLKTNIRRVGTTPHGNPLYEWDWKTGGSGRGVIAQEVMHIPGAVSQDPDGLLMVDYSKV